MQATSSDMLPFPASLTFPDVEPAVLEAEDDADLEMFGRQGPWQSFMSRVLPADARW